MLSAEGSMPASAGPRCGARVASVSRAVRSKYVEGRSATPRRSTRPACGVMCAQQHERVSVSAHSRTQCAMPGPFSSDECAVACFIATTLARRHWPVRFG
jgi:hypothetical protein